MTVRLRFPKSVRLSRAAEFRRLKSDGASFHGKYMVLSVLKSAAAEGPARVGIITSRRVGGAVVRNRARRCLREIFRAAQPQLLSGLWMVIVARQHAAQASFRQLHEEWWQLARRGGILIADAPPT